MNAVVYARVSTDGQRDTGRSLETQVAACREYAARHGFDVVNVIEDAESGARPIRQRDGGKWLYDFIDGRQVDAIICYTVDRMTRDEDLIEIALLRRDIRKAGMELHFVDSGKSDPSAFGGVIDTLKAAGAAEERRKITERGMRGKRAKAAAGRWVGAGQVPYGYHRIGTGKSARLEVHDTEAATVRRIYRMYAEGAPVTLRQIADTLQREGTPAPHGGRGWYPAFIRLVLLNPRYTGTLRQYGAQVPRPDLAIVDTSLAADARARLRANQEHASRNRQREYLLSGYARCTCGHALGGAHAGRPGKSYTYYKCNRDMRAAGAPRCAEPLLRAQAAEEAVWGTLISVFDPAGFRQSVEETAIMLSGNLAGQRAALAGVDARLAEAERRIETLGAQASTMTGSALEAVLAATRTAGARLDALRMERGRLAQNIAALESQAVTGPSLDALADEIRAAMLEAGYEDKRMLMDRLGIMLYLAHDADGRRRFDGTCSILPAPITLPDCESGLFKRDSQSRRIVLAFTISLDGQPATTLADQLFDVPRIRARAMNLGGASCNTTR